MKRAASKKQIRINNGCGRSQHRFGRKPKPAAPGSSPVENGGVEFALPLARHLVAAKAIA
jgi:hypothetical protein